MIQKRRNLLVSLGLSIAATGILPKVLTKDSGDSPKKKFKGTYTCQIKEGDADTFHSRVTGWQDNSLFNQICDKYRSKDLLLDVENHTSQQQIIWSYTFVNRMAFEQWSREIFLSGAFAPNSVEPEYEYKFSGSYV